MNLYDTLSKVKAMMNYVLSRLCTILLVLMTFLVLLQVFSRYVLNDPTSFTEELVRYLLIWTGFVGAAYAFSSRDHMALTFVRDKFDDSTRRAITVIVDVIILIFAFFILVLGGIKLAVAAQMEYSALLGVPRSIVYAMAPISGVFIIISQIINIYEDITGVQLNAPAMASVDDGASAGAAAAEENAAKDAAKASTTNTGVQQDTTSSAQK